MAPLTGHHNSVNSPVTSPLSPIQRLIRDSAEFSFAVSCTEYLCGVMLESCWIKKHRHTHRKHKTQKLQQGRSQVREVTTRVSVTPSISAAVVCQHYAGVWDFLKIIQCEREISFPAQIMGATCLSVQMSVGDS